MTSQRESHLSVALNTCLHVTATKKLKLHRWNCDRSQLYHSTLVGYLFVINTRFASDSCNNKDILLVL